MPALQVFAGPRARAHLRERGLGPADVRVIPAAAGGPKGLVLNPLDRHLFGHWLRDAGPTVHLLGASIGAWRMAVACLPDPDAGFAELAEDYIGQDYPHAPGKAPRARDVTRIFGARLDQRLGARANEVLGHPRRRLHVITSRGRHLLRREGRLRTPIGYLGAFATNLVSRRAMGGWLERVMFSDPREALPFALHDYRTRQVALTPANFSASVLASCSIPFWLDAVLASAWPSASATGGVQWPRAPAWPTSSPSWHSAPRSRPCRWCEAAATPGAQLQRELWITSRTTG